ncbi:MAG: hypothetical protein L3J38_00535 [Thiomicrorhabdus sp.]|nr:hypothetical protein [Thiomicrorhabdus sp.]
MNIRVYKKMDSLYFKKMMIVGALLTLMGCSSVKPTVEVGNQFKLGHVSLTVSQRITPVITYHTQAELQRLLTQKITVLLEQRGLLSHQPVANHLTVQVQYQRNFLDDQTPEPSSALAYPQYDYEVQVMHGTQILARISEKNRLFKGRYIMNIDVLAGRLDKKSDEIEFIDGLAKEIVRSVQKLKKAST